MLGGASSGWPFSIVARATGSTVGFRGSRPHTALAVGRHLDGIDRVGQPAGNLCAPARGNTHKLDALNGGGGVVAGLGPVVVSGSFDVPFGVLAFDEAGVGAIGRASCRERV